MNSGYYPLSGWETSTDEKSEILINLLQSSRNCCSGTLKTEYAFHQVRSELFPREPSQGFAMIDRSSRHSFVLTLQSAGSEKNQLQMPGLHPAAARMWERIQ